MFKIGLIGCGAIGSTLAKAIKKEIKNAELLVAFDIDSKKSEEFSKKFRNVKIAKTFDELISYDLKLVVEAASQKAIATFGEKILERTSLMVMSTGSLLDEKLFPALLLAAERHNRKIYVPSGAVCGIDGIKAAKLRKIYSATLTTTKPAATLNIKTKKKKIIFQGSAEKAVKLFPYSVNVAATLSLASLGGKKTKVKIVADPRARQNMHEISIKGEFGELYTKTKNFPFKENPKTSYLAALSAIRMLKNITESLVIGT